MKLKGKDNYWALLCDQTLTFKESVLICGVYSSRKEAMEVKREIADCPCHHKIVRCKVTIEVEDKTKPQ